MNQQLNLPLGECRSRRYIPPTAPGRAAMRALIEKHKAQKEQQKTQYGKLDH